MAIDLDKDQIYIQTPDGIHDTYGICIFLRNKNKETILLFKTMVIKMFNQLKWNWFLQGGSKPEENEWCYFELWNLKVDQDELLNIGLGLSQHFNLPLEIEGK